MVVSTGIGGGVVANGAPFSGGTGNAGHIGQIAVAAFAGPDVQGLEATVERVASGPNIVRWARAQGWTGESGEDLAAGYAAGDPIAVAAVRRSAAAVGAAIASATALLDVDLVVIGGGFSRVAPEYIDLVRAARDATAAYPFLARAAIAPAQLGHDSPLIGAAALVLRG
jgi:glucokinase